MKRRSEIVKVEPRKMRRRGIPHNKFLISKQELKEYKRAALPARKLKFIEEYLIDFNSVRACKAAGYLLDESKILLNNPFVNKEIRKRFEEIRKRSEITILDCISELACIALLDITQIFDMNGNIKPMDQIPENARRAIAGIELQINHRLKTKAVKLKLGNKIEAIKYILMHLGGFEIKNKQDAVNQLAESIENLNKIEII